MLPSTWKGEIKKAVQEATDRHNTSIASEINLFGNQFRAYKEQQNTDDRKERALNKITIILVFLTVLFTGGSWWEFKGQLDVMKKASAQTEKIIGTNSGLADAAAKQAKASIENAQTAHDSLVAARRAWVGPRNARSDGDPVAGRSYDVIIEYQNSGREPVLGTVFDIDAFAANLEEDTKGEAPQKIKDFINRCMIMWNPDQAQIVYPTTGFNEYNLTKTIEPSNIDDDVAQGQKTIFVSGCFAYQSFNTVHRSTFCYFFKKGKTKPSNWNICGTGNYAD
ncbi:MAG: hypothetical protein ACLP0B_19140 [Steroidobacteraceae bacterium]